MTEKSHNQAPPQGARSPEIPKPEGDIQPPPSSTRPSKFLDEAISQIPEEFRRGLDGVSRREIQWLVEQGKQDIRVPYWLHYFGGAGGKTDRRVVDDLFDLYPEFKRFIDAGKRSFPGKNERVDSKDIEIFNSWLATHSMFGARHQAIMWIASKSPEVIEYVQWSKAQKYHPEGFEYVPFPTWVDLFNRGLIKDKWWLDSEVQFEIEIGTNVFDLLAVAQKLSAPGQSRPESNPSPAHIPQKASTEREIRHYQFRFKVRIDIPGDTKDGQWNLVRVDEHSVWLNDMEFAMFLRLAAASFKVKNGQVKKQSLMEAIGKPASNADQPLGRLRSRFRDKIGDPDPGAVKQFIERRGKGSVRLSVHPDYLKINRKKLIETHHDPIVRQIAKMLPKSSK